MTSFNGNFTKSIAGSSPEDSSVTFGVDIDQSPVYLNVDVIPVFLVPSYVKDVISKDILGKDIATALFNCDCCVSLAKNFCLGAYANGTLISSTRLPVCPSKCLI